MGTDEPVGLNCPGCGKFAAIVMQGGEQAFCGNDDCSVMAWNPTKSLRQMVDSFGKIDMRWHS
jgi:hypothetical protein